MRRLIFAPSPIVANYTENTSIFHSDLKKGGLGMQRDFAKQKGLNRWELFKPFCLRSTNRNALHVLCYMF